MFDLTSSKLLILGVIALLVVGPKDLPMLLRTIGKYMGMIKRQAAEFRTQFDEAMRESELSELKKQVEEFKTETEGIVREAESDFNKEAAAIEAETAKTLEAVDKLAASEPAASADAGLATPPAPPPEPALPPAPASTPPATERAGA